MATATLARDVIANEFLLRHITTYQRGFPLAIAQFAAQHPDVQKYVRSTCGLLARLAIDQGNLALLKLLFLYCVQQPVCLIKTRYTGFQYAWRYALKHSGDLAILEWLNSQQALRGDDADPYKALMDAIDSSERFEVATWLLTHRPEYALALTKKHVHRVVYHGDLKLFQWMEANVVDLPDCSSSHLMDIAATYGHLDIVKYLHENRTEGCTTKAMDRATDLQVVRFLHENRTEGCTTDAIDGAARAGRLDTVQFLHRHRTEGRTNKAMADAAMNGHLEMVRFLHEHLSGRCTSEAMTGAARHGYLTVVQFLVTHGVEGGFERAVRSAAEGGHLEIVKYLLAVAPDTSTAHLLELAAKGGHLAVVQFVHENFHANCSRLAMIQAASGPGHFDVVQYLSDHCAASDGGALSGAAFYGHLKIVTFLAESRNDGCLIRARRRADCGTRKCTKHPPIEAYLASRIDLSIDEQTHDTYHCDNHESRLCQRLV